MTRRLFVFLLPVSLALRPSAPVCVRSLSPETDRRAALRLLGLGLAVAASPTAAADTPSAAELQKLTLGYSRIQYLLNNWDDLTTTCKGVVSDTERKQAIATNSASCSKTPLVVQEYIGYKSMDDPLFKADKLMLRAQPLLKNGDDDEYFEAVQKWGQIAQSASNTAYTSSWAGEENPNGSRKNIEAYLEQAKGDVEDSAEILKSIIDMLGLPPAPKYQPKRG